MGLWTSDSLGTLAFWEKATPEAFQEQLQNGGDKNARNKNGETPLHFAAMVGKLEAFSCLINSKPNISPRSLNGTTPLHNAVKRGDLKIIQTLLEAGADINASVDDGTRPLHIASFVEDGADIILLLLEFAENTGQNLDLDVKDSQGRTPLHIAALSGKEKTITTLLNLGADGRETDSNELTPFDRIAHSNRHLKGTKTYWLLNDARYSSDVEARWDE